MENRQFTQGIEKFMDSILGKKVDVLILAEPITGSELRSTKNGFEELYTQLSPYEKSVINLNATNGKSVTETISKGITETTNESVARTHTHTITQGTNSSDSWGGHIGLHAGIHKPDKVWNVGIDAGGDYHHQTGEHTDVADADGETITRGVSKALTEQNSTANALSSSTSDGLQIEQNNRSVKSLLDKIDRQLQRMDECEDYGMHDCCTYVLAEDYATTVAASSSFKAIMRGKDSWTESSCVNIWRNDWDETQHIMTYLKSFNHPVFALYKESEMNNEMTLPVTPATSISGKELAIQMGMPRKSVSGIPVLKTARFGRKVLYTDQYTQPENQILMGKIYHMNMVETTDVHLNADSLRSHVFITGSTGSGKSTTVYKLISETMETVPDCHFMVVEPAKGEYKSVFGGREDVTVFGTNLNEVERLLRINPFSFPQDRIHVLEHIDKLIGIFNACWPMYAAMPAILKDSIERAYVTAGWDLKTSVCKFEKKNGILVYPSFADVLAQITKVLKESQYSNDSKGDYTGALVTRIRSLTNGINGLIFTAHEIPDSELFDKNVIVDLSRVSSDETKALIMGMLLIKQQEYRVAKHIRGNEPLRHITVLEEAHNILKRASTEQSNESSNLMGKSVEMMSNAIAEMRTYGEAFVIVDQSPAAVDMSAIRNTNTKVIMRLPDITDREQVGKAASLNDEQIEELAKLSTGVAAIYQNNWIEPVLCKISALDPDSEKPYQLPAGYRPDWGDDGIIRREVIVMALDPFCESNHLKDTNAMVRRVLSSGLDATTKAEFFEFHEQIASPDDGVRKHLAENIIYRILYQDDVWSKSLEYGKNISQWYNQMKHSLRPDISGMEKEAVDRILEILLYKQQELCAEQQRGETNELLNKLERMLQERK